VIVTAYNPVKQYSADLVLSWAVTITFGKSYMQRLQALPED